MKIARIVSGLLTGFLLALSVSPGFAEMAQAPRQEAEQVLFLIDNSGSMSERGFDPAQPLTARWEICKQVLPKWLEGLTEDVRVGAVSVGGVCGTPPQINLPIGSERKAIAGAINSTAPNGQTNLNAVLQNSPNYFSMDVEGRKRIVLLSDGLNSCSPETSTCEIVRGLHRDYGISVDVVAWVTDPGMIQEFQCVAQASGGTFFAPATVKDFLDVPLFGLDLWRYVVLILGLLTLTLASQILYSHGHHALGLQSRRAVLSAGLLFSVGTLALYLVLFVGAGLGSAVLGALVLLGTFIMATMHPRPTSASGKESGATLWTFLVLTSLLVGPGHLQAAERASQDGIQDRQYPTYQHIIAMDMSGSVASVLPEMKEFVAEYAEKFVVGDEQISLLIFSYDDKGSVKEVSSFAVPKSRHIGLLTRALDDLAIQEARKTRTYFRPLADYLNSFLANVKLQPVVLVLSDGQSDGFQDAARGKVNLKEISFESLATRGVYHLPGTKNWKIAVQGGTGLDFTDLFRKPAPSRSSATKLKAHPHNSTSKPLGPIIDPCLIDPALVATTDSSIIFRPRFNRLTSTVDAWLTVSMAHACNVGRYRSLKVELTLGDGGFFEIGSVRRALIDHNPRPFTFHVAVPVETLTFKEATIRITIEQGGAPQAVYAEPGALAIEIVSYWSAYGKYWLWGGGALMVSALLLFFFARKRAQVKRNRPLVLKTIAGETALLTPHGALTLGGEGSNLPVAGVPAGVQLGFVEQAGSPLEVRLRAQSGYHMKVAGNEASDGCIYRLGQPLEFYTSDTSYELVLYPGRIEDHKFNSTLFSSDQEGSSSLGHPLNDSFISPGGNGSGAPLI